MAMTYAHPSLGHGRDLRDVLRAEGATTQAQPFWRAPATLSPAPQPSEARIHRPSRTNDAFLARLEETENLSPKVFNVRPEFGPQSRTPPNFPMGRHDQFYLDSSLVAKLGDVRHRQRIPGEARVRGCSQMD